MDSIGLNDYVRENDYVRVPVMEFVYLVFTRVPGESYKVR